MKNGPHTHECPCCGEEFQCQAVTHCSINEDDLSLIVKICPNDCAESQIDK